MKTHTDQEFERELMSIRTRLMTMWGSVEQMLAGAMEALQNADRGMAESVIAKDRDINNMEIEVDEMCLTVLALRQPAASDLRFLAFSLKVVTDLERIGDLAVNIAERVVELCALPPLKPYIALPHMCKIAREMLTQSLEAFVRRDPEIARSCFARDNVVDAYYVKILRELLTYMMEDPRNIPRVFKLLAIAKTIERVGDHATNLAEQVIFLLEGHDIRHKGIGKPERPIAVLVKPSKGVLFVSLANSARGPIAVAWAKRLAPSNIEVGCAGIKKGVVHPLAHAVMEEVGLDCAEVHPKSLDEVDFGAFDLVVTLCEEGAKLAFPEGVHHVQWPIEDPSESAGKPDTIKVFRAVRDDLASRVEQMFRET
jgi:phosphate transport system protein